MVVSLRTGGDIADSAGVSPEESDEAALPGESQEFLMCQYWSVSLTRTTPWLRRSCSCGTDSNCSKKIVRKGVGRYQLALLDDGNNE